MMMLNVIIAIDTMNCIKEYTDLSYDLYSCLSDRLSIPSEALLDHLMLDVQLVVPCHVHCIQMHLQWLSKGDIGVNPQLLP